MKIRLKILSGFLVIVAMLIIAGAFAIIEFRKLSKSVESLLADNYASIEACNNMLEGLEREDSGVLLYMLGQKEHGKASVFEGDSIFMKSLDIARNNVTESNEGKYIITLEKNYADYILNWKQLVETTDGHLNLDWYFNNMYNRFYLVKTSVKDLMKLNQESMYNESFLLRDKAQRAVMPGFVAVAAALIFAILFNFFINYYFVSPVLRLIRAVNQHHSGIKELDANIETHDELKSLEEAIRNLIVRLDTKNK